MSEHEVFGYQGVGLSEKDLLEVQTTQNIYSALLDAKLTYAQIKRIGEITDKYGN